MCVCPFLAFWISRAQRWSRLWQSAAAPLFALRHTRMCTHTYKYDWHTITCLLNLKGWFYLALNSVLTCPNVGTSIKAETNTSPVKLFECAMEVTGLTTHALCISLHTSFFFPFVCFVSGILCYWHVSAWIILKLCFSFFAWNYWQTDIKTCSWERQQLALLWVQGGTVKPALTQPWDLRNIPEHLMWALRWPLESISKQACKHPGCVRIYIPSYFVYFTCLFPYVCLTREQVAGILITVKRSWYLHVDFAPFVCTIITRCVGNKKKIHNEMLTFHKILLLFFVQIRLLFKILVYFRGYSHI